jgi:hypothetical protein
MTETEKLEQLAKTGAASGNGEVINDLETLYPTGKVFELAGRKYTILPLNLPQLVLLADMRKAFLKLSGDISNEDIVPLVDLFSSILKEPDKNFIRESMNIPKIKELMDLVNELNYGKKKQAAGTAA